MFAAFSFVFESPELTLLQVLSVSVVLTVRNLSFKHRHKVVLLFCPFKIKTNQKNILKVSLRNCTKPKLVSTVLDFIAEAYQWGPPEPKTTLCSLLLGHIQSDLQVYSATEKYTI